MRVVATSLEQDLARRSSASYLVARITLDEGFLFLSEIPGNLGSDEITSGVYGLSREGAEVEVSSLPRQFTDAHWAHRVITIFECTPEMASVLEGAVQFTGEILGEPQNKDGILSLAFGDPRTTIVNVPDFGVVDKQRFPTAPEESIGKDIPLIFGSVDICPLIPLSTLILGALESPAFPGDNKLAVAGAKDFPEYGAVWVDSESIYYSSRSDTELLGCTVKEAHAVGTSVSFASEAVYLAAGNACMSVSNVRGNDALLSFDLFSTDRIAFTKPPLAPTKAEEYNTLLQFDQVASAAFTQNYTVTYNSSGTASVDLNSSGEKVTTPSTSNGAAQIPSTKTSKSTAISYVGQSAYRASDYDYYGDIYYHQPVVAMTFGSTYADLTRYGRIVFTLTAEEVLDIPVGAKATIKVEYAESQGNYRDGITISNAYAINGIAIESSLQLDVVGEVTFASSITLIVSTSHVAFLADMTGKMMRVNLGAALTLEDIIANSSWGPWVGPDFDFKAATRVTAEWLQ